MLIQRLCGLRLRGGAALGLAACSGHGLDNGFFGPVQTRSLRLYLVLEIGFDAGFDKNLVEFAVQRVQQRHIVIAEKTQCLLKCRDIFADRREGIGESLHDVSRMKGRAGLPGIPIRQHGRADGQAFKFDLVPLDPGVDNLVHGQLAVHLIHSDQIELACRRVLAVGRAWLGFLQAVAQRGGEVFQQTLAALVERAQRVVVDILIGLIGLIGPVRRSGQLGQAIAEFDKKAAHGPAQAAHALAAHVAKRARGVFAEGQPQHRVGFHDLNEIIGKLAVGQDFDHPPSGAADTPFDTDLRFLVLRDPGDGQLHGQTGSGRRFHHLLGLEHQPPAIVDLSGTGETQAIGHSYVGGQLGRFTTHNGLS